jgi:TonB family protein
MPHVESHHAGIAAFVFAVHLSVLVLVAMMARPDRHAEIPVGSVTLMTISPVSRAAAARPRLAIALVHPPEIAATLPVVAAVPPDDVESMPQQRSARTIPPRPDDLTQMASRAYSDHAGIPHGLGVTVVLRVEIRSTGAVGRVQVDVSGGLRQVDQAAIAYVRSLHWVAGRVDDQPKTLWIRWGVRLEA